MNDQSRQDFSRTQAYELAKGFLHGFNMQPVQLQLQPLSTNAASRNENEPVDNTFLSASRVADSITTQELKNISRVQFYILVLTRTSRALEKELL